MQTPQLPDSSQVQIPLPGFLEAWRDLYLQSALEKLIVFLAFVAVFHLATRLVYRSIDANIEDINRRHAIRKGVKYAYIVLLLLVAIALFADWLSGLGTILALLIAGAAVALQDVLRSVVGWLYLSSRQGVEIGSRLEVGGIVGDVIDIGVLKTTMIEVGGTLVYGRQSTGRLVAVPNYRLLSDSVLIAPASSPFVWQEVKVAVTYDSDWRRLEQILNQIGQEIYDEVAPQLEEGFRRLERRYAFKYGKLTPIVYVSLGDSGAELTLRFLVHIRRRRWAVDLVSRRVLATLAEEPNLRIAHTAYRIYREGAEGENPLDS
jgi:small-conductance mechanosensitive channel